MDSVCGIVAVFIHEASLNTISLTGQQCMSTAAAIAASPLMQAGRRMRSRQANLPS